MAPLLVDDRRHGRALLQQSVSDLLCATTSRAYESFPWLGTQISEAELEREHGTSSCSELDALYHIKVLRSQLLLYPDWRWVVVHPKHFQVQQSAMLFELWKRLAETANLPSVAKSYQEREDALAARLREAVLSRFNHHWVGDDGRVESVTRPVWTRGVVSHEPLALMPALSV